MFIQKYKKKFIYYLIFVFLLNLVFNLVSYLNQIQTKLVIEFIPPNNLNLNEHLVHENYISSRINRLLKLSTINFEIPLISNLHTKSLLMLDNKKDLFQILKLNNLKYEKYIRFERPKITFIFSKNQNLNYEKIEKKLKNDIVELLSRQLDLEIQNVMDVINNSNYKKKYSFHYDRLDELFKEMYSLKENQIKSIFQSSIKLKFYHEENNIDNFKRLLFFLISLLIIFALMTSYHKYNLKI